MLNDEGYTDMNGKPAGEETDFKVKSRVTAREINVTVSGGKTQDIISLHKVIVEVKK